MTVIKRNPKDTNKSLIDAIGALVPYLNDQGEKEAAEFLQKASSKLLKGPGSQLHMEGVKDVVEAFEGEHELMAYTFQREGSHKQWTEVEELSQLSARVLSLARRMLP